MNTKNRVHKDSTDKAVRDIRRATRRHYSAKEKVRIVLEGLRGEDSIAELCLKEGINQNLYCRWSPALTGSTTFRWFISRCSMGVVEFLCMT